MENTRPLVLVAVIAVGAAACSKPKVNHVVELTGSPKTVEVRITVDGKIRGPYRLPTPETVLPVDLGGFEQPPVISAQVLLPCGWSDVQVRPPAGTGTPQRHFVRVPPTKPLGVWVDNRGGGQTKASLGELEIAIPAGFTGSFHVPAPTCEAGAKLRFGEAELPVVQDSDMSPKDRRTAPAYLIDTSGVRCYRSRALDYVHLTMVPGALPGPKEARLRPARLHALIADADYFLQPAPETVQSKSIAVRKHELTEIPCSPRTY